ncbi:hypothetical protein [Pseudobacteriovorax antillogorgiicola]|uniref:Uncharacterized protein n=2 Tax=Pseudobacteriovorax antillogorgiicola TaxID=1513793 RepID=A0A1Y6BEE1_9BACT|nr:hypothetical protein [Pseudobacteriovorax antillogorgiicola]TCS56320.1 hypothetical protein EDD56_104142 [Pseudobacteriovorax antillogorgiicola]SMF07094.1 hypothetical protein SAMN06296036_104191 [Pseudobacteriovorax antillogorgiicola]
MLRLYFFLGLISFACGYSDYERVVYPQASPQELAGDTTCALSFAAYDYLVKDAIAMSCTSGCHELGGIGEAALKFTGDTQDDSTLLLDWLRTQENLFLDKATGRIDHLGGPALDAMGEQDMLNFKNIQDYCRT